MRLQLTLLVAMTASVQAQPADPPSASAGLHVYADDDHVSVVSPSASIRTDVTPHVSLTVDTTVDAVSAASVDVVTSASPSVMHEQRIELGLASTYHQRTSGWTAGVRASHEHDYDALRLRGTARTELAQRNTTLQLDYVFGHDDVTSMMDPGFHRTRASHELELTVSQLLSPRAIVDVIADGAAADGYHASPYRQILVDVPASPLPMRVEEVTPNLRTSIAIAGRLRYALADYTASASYRLYHDSWSIRSHTVTVELVRKIGGALIGATLRGYAQTGAEFYASHYSMDARYRTRDRTLGAMRSIYGAATVDAPVERWHLLVSAGLLRLRFLEFAPQADRNAVLLFSGATRTW